MIRQAVLTTGFTLICLSLGASHAGHNYYHSEKHSNHENFELPSGYQAQIALPSNAPEPNRSKNDPEAAILKLKFKLSARNLPSKDKLGKSDPYVVVSYTEHKVKGEVTLGQTGVLKDTLNPNWGDVFRMTYVKGNQQVLRFAIWDKDMIYDDKIGEAKLKLEDYVRSGEFEQINLKDGYLVVEKA